jgi:CHAT domain-containing protein
MGRWGRPSAATLFLILLTSCSNNPGSAYQQAWSTYLSGDLPRTLEITSRNAQRWERDRNSPWFWRFRLLAAETLTSQSKFREADQLLRDPVPDKPELEQLEFRHLIDQAGLRRGNDAAMILERARKIGKDPELIIRLHLADGSAHLDLNAWAAAQDSFHQALDDARRLSSSYWEALALNNLSYCAKLLRRHEESVELGEQAVSIADKAGARRVAAMAHGNLGSEYSFLGEPDLALQNESKAVATFKAIGAQNNLMLALGELGLTYDRRGERDNAIENYTDAYHIARDLNRRGDAERHADNLSAAFINASDWDRAAEWNQRASELISPDDAEAVAYLARNRATIAYGKGQRDEAAAICQDLIRSEKTPASVLWEAHSLLGRMAAESRQFPKANREFEQALKIIEDTRSSMAKSRYRITLLSRLIQFYQDYVDALVEQNDDAGALRITESSRARVLAERLSDQASGSFPGVSDLQKLASSSRASFVSFWIAPKRSFAWLITARGIRRFPLPAANEIADRVAEYRQAIERSLQDPISSKNAAENAAGSAPGSAPGRALWSELASAFADEIPAKSRVILIPDGPLHRLNFETLPVAGLRPHYWIEDAEIAVAPSLTFAAARASVSSTASSDPPRLLLIGNPDYSGTRYPALPNAGKELSDIERQFPTSECVSFQGARATPAAYRSANPERFSYIHFAAHAEADTENPLESAIVLSPEAHDNRLYARDVVETPIRANLVTISGCRTAGARAYAGEGLVGFVWAFLRAGARSVVAGLWDVSDTSTEPLMNRFYAHLASGADPVSALHEAKLEMLKDARFAKPYYWAPFQIYVRSVR